MKKISTIILQVIIVALGLAILAALLFEPTVEGVNANATSLYQIYFDDPFLAYIYFSFIAVFVGLCQVFKIAGYIGSDAMYSQPVVQSLRTIKYCALTFAGLIFAALAYIVANINGSDDIAGGVAMGLFLVLMSLVTATVAAVFERRMRNNLSI